MRSVGNGNDGVPATPSKHPPSTVNFLPSAKGSPAETLKAMSHFGNEHGCPAKPMKKGASEPRPLLTPRPRGTLEQHKARRSLGRERGPSAASSVQEPVGSGWSFVRKQKLDARASIQIVIATLRYKGHPCKWGYESGSVAMACDRAATANGRKPGHFDSLPTRKGMDKGSGSHHILPGRRLALGYEGANLGGWQKDFMFTLRQTRSATSPPPPDGQHFPAWAPPGASPARARSKRESCAAFCSAG